MQERREFKWKVRKKCSMLLISFTKSKSDFHDPYYRVTGLSGVHALHGATVVWVVLLPY